MMEPCLVETRQIVSPGFVRKWDASAIGETRYLGVEEVIGHGAWMSQKVSFVLRVVFELSLTPSLISSLYIPLLDS